MADFGTLVETIEEEVFEPNDRPAIRRAIVTSLNYYRPKQFVFSDKAGSFLLVPGQSDYVRGMDFPGDLMSVDHIRVLQGDTDLRNELVRIDLSRMRRLQTTTVASTSPLYWTWYDNAIILWPTPGENRTLHMDYKIDATKDERTGKLISAHVELGLLNIMTNEFFRTGEELLRTRAVVTYSTVRGHDPQTVSGHAGLNSAAERSLMLERDSLKIKGQQTTRYF